MPENNIITIPSYLTQLAGKTLSYARINKPAIKTIGKHSTFSSVFANEISAAQSELIRYFKSSPKKLRPLNSLLLGPPGSGKSFLSSTLGSSLAKALGDSASNKEHKCEQIQFYEYNLSQFHNPADLRLIFSELARNQETKKIVLLDEFDVRIGSSSAIRYLIQPMYDNKFGQEPASFGKTAFIFSGSYLKDRATLERIMGVYSLIDLPKIIFDVYQSRMGSGTDEGVRDLFDAITSFHRYREETARDGDVITYLRSLEKFTDFVSRINGFIVEIPDLSSPLEETEPWNRLLAGGESSADGGVQAMKPDNIMRWVRAVETSTRRIGAKTMSLMPLMRFMSPQSPALEYKDIFFNERLLRAAYFIDDLFGSAPEWMIEKSLLNYLCTAPLVHGMRSLETIIGTLRQDGGMLVLDGFNGGVGGSGTDVVKRHIRQNGRISDRFILWDVLFKEEPDGMITFVTRSGSAAAS